MIREKESVCAVVVTYNRKELLIECLEALRMQVRPIQGIYLIDNASTDGTPNLLLEKGYIGKLPPENLTEPWEREFEIKNLTDGKSIKLHYVRMHENTGGAGGFHEGVKRAYEKGYDWLWLMDDDAEPKNDTLRNLLLAKVDNSVAALCPLILHKSGDYQLYHHKFINKWNMEDIPVVDSVEKLEPITEIEANAFVGPLINRNFIKMVGFPRKELFIWGDDTEYMYRLSRLGKVLLCKNAVILHKDTRKKLDSKSAKKYYFYFRNRIFIIRHYSKLKFFAYLYFIYKAVRTTISFRMKYKLPLSVSTAPVKGIWDGVKIYLVTEIFRRL